MIPNGIILLTDWRHQLLPIFQNDDSFGVYNLTVVLPNANGIKLDLIKVVKEFMRLDLKILRSAYYARVGKVPLI